MNVTTRPEMEKAFFSDDFEKSRRLRDLIEHRLQGRAT